VWLEEVPASLPVDYFFTAKEFDPETGFYNFGARYLDPRFSKWMSTDPALGKHLPGTGQALAYQSPSLATSWRSYPDLPGMGGVFQPTNLALYGYGHHNPATLLDPNGLEPQSAESPGFFRSMLTSVANWWTTPETEGNYIREIVPGTCDICVAHPEFAMPADYATAEFVDRPITRGDIVDAALLPLSLVPGVRAGGTAVTATARTLTAAERVAELAAKGLTQIQRERFIVIAVTETKEGVRVVSTSEPLVRQSIMNLLKEGEAMAEGGGHAEQQGVRGARSLGLTPTGVAASKPICARICQPFLAREGVAPLTPLEKAPR